MQRDELEMKYLAGEMSPSEELAYEASLKGEAREETLDLRAFFGDLKSLNDGIPEPQISFARIQDAIERGPIAAPAPKVLNLRWLFVAAPAAAAVMVGVMMSNMPAPQAGGEPAPVVAQGEPGSTMGVAANPERETTEREATAPEAKVADAKRADEFSDVPEGNSAYQAQPAPKTRAREPRRLIASADRPRGRSMSSLDAASSNAARTFTDATVDISTKSTPMTAGASADAATNEAPTGLGTGAPMTRMSVGSPQAATSEASDKPEVVIVTTRQDSSTGAQAAKEVESNDDIVLGG